MWRLIGLITVKRMMWAMWPVAFTVDGSVGVGDKDKDHHSLIVDGVGLTLMTRDEKTVERNCTLAASHQRRPSRSSPPVTSYNTVTQAQNACPVLYMEPSFGGHFLHWVVGTRVGKHLR